MSRRPEGSSSPFYDHEFVMRASKYKYRPPKAAAAMPIPIAANSEDCNNIKAILLHHLGHPWPVDGVRLGLLGAREFRALEEDLLRYCTVLRHLHEPKHRLVEE